MKLEAESSPPGGDLTVDYHLKNQLLTIRMSSADLSTMRAMLNSYMGLVGTAVNTAWK